MNYVKLRFWYSVPPGVDKDIYAVMTSMANEAGVKVVLDAVGDLLREGVKAKPYLIKPNQEEFVKTFLQEENLSDAYIQRIPKELLSNGLNYVCLSLGADGAMLISKNTIEKRPAISVPIRSLQGAGDAMVAGLCKALYDNEEDKILEYALNMAASTIMLEGTRMGDKYTDTIDEMQ